MFEWWNRCHGASAHEHHTYSHLSWNMLPLAAQKSFGSVFSWLVADLSPSFCPNRTKSVLLASQIQICQLDLLHLTLCERNVSVFWTPVLCMILDVLQSHNPQGKRHQPSIGWLTTFNRKTWNSGFCSQESRSERFTSFAFWISAGGTSSIQQQAIQRRCVSLLCSSDLYPSCCHDTVPAQQALIWDY